MLFSKATCRWTILGAFADVQRTEERGRILAALDEEGAPMRPKDIADAIGQPSNNVRRLIRKMAKAGEVRLAKYGLYVLPDPPSSPSNSSNEGNSSKRE
jgi:hypothetical protein